MKEVTSAGEKEQVGEPNPNLEEDGLDSNIIHVTQTGDLSPKQAQNLIAKRGKSGIPLQVQTRSNKGRTQSCDQ